MNLNIKVYFLITLQNVNDGIGDPPDPVSFQIKFKLMNLKKNSVGQNTRSSDGPDSGQPQ